MSNVPAPADEARPWKRGALWLLVLGPFFFASYGFSNWVASRHAEVPVLAFEWERAIPFLAWTIVPYWAIDACYAASLLLCATRAQLAVHVKRLIAVQVIAVACFLAFPLRYSFERPPVDGAFGWMFAALTSFDLPFNQAPSLHVALLVILHDLYRQVLPRRWHLALHAACALIGVSVLTTWQHHFVDIPTGAWLGAFCVYLFPRAGPSPFTFAFTRDRARRRLSARYAGGALIIAALAMLAGGAALWLLWLGGALALVAATYALGGEWSFQKRADGRMAGAALALYAPYCFAAWVNSRAWTRALPPAVEIAPGVLVGRIPTRVELRQFGVVAVVDLCAELPLDVHGLRYFSVPMLDLVVPTTDRIQQAVIAIETARAVGPVLVCCALGFSRSASAVSAWLMRSEVATTVSDACERVSLARRGSVLTPGHRAALARWRTHHGSQMICVAAARPPIAERSNGLVSSSSAP